MRGKRRARKAQPVNEGDSGDGPARPLVNMDSFSVLDDHLDAETEMASWFCSGMSRSEVTHMALSILERGKPGEFLVRDKKGEPNCYALSVKSPNVLRKEFLSFIIEKSPDEKRPGYVVRGAEILVFPAVSRLVAYFAEARRDELGVRLVEPGDYLGAFESMHAAEPAKASRGSAGAEPSSNGKSGGSAAASAPAPASSDAGGAASVGGSGSADNDAGEECDGFGEQDESDEAQGGGDTAGAAGASAPAPRPSDVRQELRAVFDDLPEGDDGDAGTEWGFGSDGDGEDDDDEGA